MQRQFGEPAIHYRHYSFGDAIPECFIPCMQDGKADFYICITQKGMISFQSIWSSSLPEEVTCEVCKQMALRGLRT